MALTTVSRVKARSGKLLADLSGSTTPTEDDVAAFIEETDGEILAVIAAHGFSVPITSAVVLDALVGIATDCALSKALDARFSAHANTPNSQPLPILERLEKRCEMHMATLMKGTHPVIRTLHEEEATAAGDSAGGAESLWTDEPAYDPEILSTQRSGFDEHLDPILYRGMQL